MESNQHYCDLCGFTGKNNKGINQHKKTLKHMRNINKKIKEEGIDQCQFIDNQYSLSDDALNNINSNISNAMNEVDKINKAEEIDITSNDNEIISNKNFYRDIDTLTVNNINNLNIRFRNISQEEIIKLFNSYQNMEFNNKTGSFSNTNFS